MIVIGVICMFSSTFGAPGPSESLLGPILEALPKKDGKSWSVDPPSRPIEDHIWRHFRNRSGKEETSRRLLQRPERQKRRSVATFVPRSVFASPGDAVKKVNVANHNSVVQKQSPAAAHL